MEDLSTIQRIPLERLHPHPQNANVMPPATMKKLQRHIEKTGRYEPLIVRPHPTIPGAFELINGHHRKRILATLGHATANCLVWPLDDAETLLLLATINRLAGEDRPGQRLSLLESLSKAMRASSEQLAKLLPEHQATLRNLLTNAPPPRIARPPALPEMLEPFTVFLARANKQRLVAALKQTDPDTARALLRWLHDRTDPTEPAA